MRQVSTAMTKTDADCLRLLPDSRLGSFHRLSDRDHRCPRFRMGFELPQILFSPRFADIGSGTRARPFYDFCLDEHVPCDHPLRGVDRHLDLADLRHLLKPFLQPDSPTLGRSGADDPHADRRLQHRFCLARDLDRREATKPAHNEDRARG